MKLSEMKKEEAPKEDTKEKEDALLVAQTLMEDNEVKVYIASVRGAEKYRIAKKLLDDNSP